MLDSFHADGQLAKAILAPSDHMLREQRSPMSASSTETATPLAARQYLPLLLALFVGSGLCALIYEVIWFQLLGMVIGSTAVSIGVLLATFMGGMCIGSLALPRFVSRRHHPLRVYALLEFGIGVVGILELLLVPLVSYVYTSIVGHGFLGILLRGLVCAICLLPPTILMGATLPAVSRWIEVNPRGVSWMGLLYGGNTVGAVLGGVLAGFYLLREHDVSYATFVAAALNASIALVAWGLSQRAPGGEPEADSKATAGPVARAPGSWAVYLTIAVSGAAALGAEVVWTRLLALMLGGTVYTFSMILAVFLTGLGIGSGGGAWLARRSLRPRLALGWMQLLQTLGVAWAAWMVASVLPYWPINPSLAPSPWLTMHLDLTRTMWVVLPSSLLWGASFPLALASVARPGEDSARLVSGVYAANTVGAIVGALAFSLVLIPDVGTRTAQQWLIGLSALAALAMFVTQAAAGRAPAAAKEQVRPRHLTALVSGVAAVVLGLFASSRVPDVPGLLVAYGRYMVTWLDQVDMLYVGEGMNSSIAVTRLHSSGAMQFHVAGKVEASSLPQDMRLQRMLGHLPALLDRDPQSVLVVGFGAGVTAGSFVNYPELKRLVICEIEPLIPRVMGEYFSQQNHDVLRDPRTEIVYDDARSYVLTTHDKFDIITSDPIHPWVKGAASLYTKEYFQNVRDHLTPGGVVSQWVPLYESNADAVKSQIATFLEVFPDGTVWANNINGQGYDIVLLGRNDPSPIDIDAINARLARPDYQGVTASLGEVGFTSLLDLLSTYTADGRDLQGWLSDAQINRDRNLRLQYIAGVGLNRYQSEGIYEQIVSHRRFPDALFHANEAWKEQLRNALMGWRATP